MRKGGATDWIPVEVMDADLPPLKVLLVIEGGEPVYYSFDTRRLYCMKEAEKYKPKQDVAVNLITESEFWADDKLIEDFYKKLGHNDTFMKMDEVLIRDGQSPSTIREGPNGGKHIFVQDKKTYVSQLTPTQRKDLALRTRRAAYKAKDDGDLIYEILSRQKGTIDLPGDVLMEMISRAPGLSKDELVHTLLRIDDAEQQNADSEADRKGELMREILRRSCEDEGPGGVPDAKYLTGTVTVAGLQACLDEMDAAARSARSRPQTFLPTPPPRGSRVARLQAPAASAGSGGNYCSGSCGGGYGYSSGCGGVGLRTMHNGWQFPGDMASSDIHRVMQVNGNLESGHGAISDRPVNYGDH